MSYIGNQFRKITLNNINTIPLINNKTPMKNSMPLRKTINNLIDEIEIAQTNFKWKWKSLVSKYGFERTYKDEKNENIIKEELDFNEQYYQDIKKIFNKYSSVYTCDSIKNKNNYKKCHENKIHYYKSLTHYLNEDYLITRDSGVKNRISENYSDIIKKFAEKHKEKLLDKITKHKEIIKKLNQKGGKKITKKTTIKKDTKKPKKSV